MTHKREAAGIVRINPLRKNPVCLEWKARKLQQENMRQGWDITTRLFNFNNEYIVADGKAEMQVGSSGQPMCNGSSTLFYTKREDQMAAERSVLCFLNVDVS